MIAAAMGWMGTLGTMGAYVMLSRGRWHSASLRYSALNGVGGLLGGTAGVIYGAWPCVGSNAIWTFVAAHSAVRTIQARRTQTRDRAALPVMSGRSDRPRRSPVVSAGRARLGPPSRRKRHEHRGPRGVLRVPRPLHPRLLEEACAGCA
jgi:hypothetical protein